MRQRRRRVVTLGPELRFFPPTGAQAFFLAGDFLDFFLAAMTFFYSAAATEAASNSESSFRRIKSAVISTTRSKVHGTVSTRAATAGVVLSVVCFRTKL